MFTDRPCLIGFWRHFRCFLPRSCASVTHLSHILFHMMIVHFWLIYRYTTLYQSCTKFHQHVVRRSHGIDSHGVCLYTHAISVLFYCLSPWHRVLLMSLYLVVAHNAFAWHLDALKADIGYGWHALVKSLRTSSLKIISPTKLTTSRQYWRFLAHETVISCVRWTTFIYWHSSTSDHEH